MAIVEQGDYPMQMLQQVIGHNNVDRIVECQAGL